MSSNPNALNVSDLRVSCADCSLSELCLPRGLSEEEVGLLDARLERSRSLNRGDILFGDGDQARYLYAVRSGSFKTQSSNADGNEQIYGFHLAGELMGFDAMEKGHHKCSAVALESASVCGLPIDQLESLCHDVPSLQRHMLHLISHVVNDDHSMLLLLGKASAEERLATFLLSLSTRFQSRGFSASEFNLSMSRHDIGNFLGLAVETVSRVFTHFQESGLIVVNRRAVQIIDLDRLREIVSHCSG